MQQIPPSVEVMVVEVEVTGSEVVGAVEAENIVMVELKVDSAGMVAVAAELGFGIVDVESQIVELVKGSKARAVKMGQKGFGAEVTGLEIE